mmetsp:Transcript_5534/g.12728  ORF Transcript_5534/g.12728 Transcript_5534/m.12728 type:complete len:322 (-) Transcript_5534:1584-2549(-)
MAVQVEQEASVANSARLSNNNNRSNREWRAAHLVAAMHSVVLVHSDSSKIQVLEEEWVVVLDRHNSNKVVHSESLHLLVHSEEVVDLARLQQHQVLEVALLVSPKQLEGSELLNQLLVPLQQPKAALGLQVEDLIVELLVGSILVQEDLGHNSNSRSSRALELSRPVSVLLEDSVVHLEPVRAGLEISSNSSPNKGLRLEASVRPPLEPVGPPVSAQHSLKEPNHKGLEGSEQHKAKLQNHLLVALGHKVLSHQHLLLASSVLASGQNPLVNLVLQHRVDLVVLVPLHLRLVEQGSVASRLVEALVPNRQQRVGRASGASQ